MKALIPFAIFWGVILSVVTLTHIYLGVRLATALPSGSNARRYLWIMVSIHGLIILVSPFLSRAFRGSGEIESRLIAYLPSFGFYLLGLVTTATFLFLLWDFFHWIISSTNSFQADRRNFLIQWMPWGALGLAGALSVQGFRQAMQGPQIANIRVPKPNLHPSLEGFRILQISDLHIGGLVRRDYVDKVVELALKESADLIAVTGDLVDGSPEQLNAHAEPLRKLSAKYGVYFVPGNHEYYSGWSPWRRHLASLGMKILENQYIDLKIKGSSSESAVLRISGLSDPTASRFDEEDPKISWSLSDQDSSPHYSLWLAHQPKLYKIVETSSCDLQLSGHTHSGQFYPIASLIGLFHKYSSGLNLHDSRFWVYVNRGTGFWGPPNRLGLPAEITVLKLESGPYEA